HQVLGILFLESVFLYIEWVSLLIALNRNNAQHFATTTRLVALGFDIPFGGLKARKESGSLVRGNGSSGNWVFGALRCRPPAKPKLCKTKAPLITSLSCCAGQIELLFCIVRRQPDVRVRQAF